MLTKQEKYTEQELIASLQRRDQSAFSYLYDQYSGALYSVINIELTIAAGLLRIIISCSGQSTFFMNDVYIEC